MADKPEKKGRSFLFDLFANKSKDDSNVVLAEEDIDPDGQVQEADQADNTDADGDEDADIMEDAQPSQEIDTDVDTEQNEIHIDGLISDDDAAKQAEEIIGVQDAANAPQEQQDEMNEDGTYKPVDAKIEVFVAQGGMEAYIEVSAPRHGGAEIDPRTIRQAISAAGVTMGIDDQAVFGVAINKPYGQGRIMIAKGVPPVDGEDGVVTELFERDPAPIPQMKADGTVDFKQLNTVREVDEGTIICTATPPTQGSPGMTVTGTTLVAKPGRDEKLPRGLNTVISEDGLQLRAGASGNLVFRENLFNVDTTLKVEAVDATTGSVSFSGDILVQGDVREGYAVTSAKGSVKVMGSVEAGIIKAEGDIVIGGGFNGINRGKLTSNGKITSKFLQNGTIYAKDDITTETIINSVVDCDSQIIVTKGKGTIVGGKITALKSVEANIIGSDVNTPTSISVGLSPTIVADKKALENEMEEIEKSKESLRKNLIYLERCSKMGALSPKNLALLDTCNKQKVLIVVQENTCKSRIAEVSAIIEEAAAGSWVKARTVYPSTKVSIQNISVMTRMVHSKAVFRRESGEIQIGTY